MFIVRLSERLSGEKPHPKPYYYHRMNPEELAIWEIIVSTPMLPFRLSSWTS
jgi:hypothetical protein